MDTKRLRVCASLLVAALKKLKNLIQIGYIMAMNVNMCCISGNLTRDAELKVTPSGTQVLHFTVACNESHKKQDGTYEDVANFFDCVTFGNRAEALARYLYKGIRVTVQGRLKWSSWEKDGQRHSKVEIIADRTELPPRSQQQGYAQSAPQAPYGAQNQQGGQGYAQPAYNAPQAAHSAPAAYVNPAPTAPAAPTPAEYDDDIPF